MRWWIPMMVVISSESCVASPRTDDWEDQPQPSAGSDFVATEALGDAASVREPSSMRHGLAHDAFADAAIGMPPPPMGSTAPLLRLTRPQRSADELAQRLSAVLTAMDLVLQPSEALAWAQSAVEEGDPAEPRISEPMPGLVVSYDPRIDELMVVDTALLDMHTRLASDTVPWDSARRVMRSLITQGIVDASHALHDAEVTFIRSGVRGPDGFHEQWVDEVVFEVAPSLGGIAVADAGARIGITPTGGTSSVQITGIEIDHVGTVTIGTTARALEDAFADYLVSLGLPFEAVQVGMRRPIYLLNPNEATGLVEPRYLVSSAIVIRDGDVRSTSRSTTTLWSLLSPNPTLAARLPSTTGSSGTRGRI